MSHTTHGKAKLLNRVRRIRGQLGAIERQLDEEEDCNTILLTIAAARGAMNALMAEVIEGHIRDHVVDRHHGAAAAARAGEQLIDVVKAYLK